MENSPRLIAWLEGFSARAAEGGLAEHVIDLIDTGIIGQVAPVRADSLLVEELHRSTRAHWHSFVNSLTAPKAPLVLPTPAADLARTIARRRLELGVLLKIYRVGNQYLWTYFTEVLDELPDGGPSRDEVLMFLWSRGWAWLDESIEQLTEIFFEERERAMEGRIARRVEIIEALLGGQPRPVEEASRALGHALDQYQTAAVLWIDEPQPDSIASLQKAAQVVASALGAPRPLTTVSGSRDLWCWAATPAPPDVPARIGPSWHAAFPDVHLAVGSTAPGVVGFRTSHEEARAVQQLVVSAARPPEVVRYDEVDLLCLAGREPGAIARMVARELGDLAAASKSIGVVRETLLAYLTAGANVEAAAERLYVHRNTVRYRLTRAEELLGRSVADRTAHLELALRYVEFFGVPVTTDDAGEAASRRR